VIFSFGESTPVRVVLVGGPVPIGCEVDAGGIRLDDRPV